MRGGLRSGFIIYWKNFRRRAETPDSYLVLLLLLTVPPPHCVVWPKENSGTKTRRSSSRGLYRCRWTTYWDALSTNAACLAVTLVTQVSDVSLRLVHVPKQQQGPAGESRSVWGSSRCVWERAKGSLQDYKWAASQLRLSDAMMSKRWKIASRRGSLKSWSCRNDLHCSIILSLSIKGLSPGLSEV